MNTFQINEKYLSQIPAFPGLGKDKTQARTQYGVSLHESFGSLMVGIVTGKQYAGTGQPACILRVLAH